MIFRGVDMSYDEQEGEGKDNIVKGIPSKWVIDRLRLPARSLERVKVASVSL